jgi:hypothetical protein
MYIPTTIFSDTCTSLGGTISEYYSGSVKYNVHSFLSGSGKFEAAQRLNATILMVGLGGFARSPTVNGGGGGAGGLIYSQSYELLPTVYSTFVDIPPTGGTGAGLENSGNTTFGTLVALMGGRPSGSSGKNGGSGQGGYQAQTGGLSLEGQGNDGGNGAVPPYVGGTSAGGGGAGAKGGDKPAGNFNGAGGEGRFFPMFRARIVDNEVISNYGAAITGQYGGWFAGGGGGGSVSSTAPRGAGGAGGGGTGGQLSGPATDGENGTGGGAGSGNPPARGYAIGGTGAIFVAYSQSAECFDVNNALPTGSSSIRVRFWNKGRQDFPTYAQFQPYGSSSWYGNEVPSMGANFVGTQNIPYSVCIESGSKISYLVPTGYSADIYYDIVGPCTTSLDPIYCNCLNLRFSAPPLENCTASYYPCGEVLKPGYGLYDTATRIIIPSGTFVDACVVSGSWNDITGTGASITLLGSCTSSFCP